jgi:hypothetical protein
MTILQIIHHVVWRSYRMPMIFMGKKYDVIRFSYDYHRQKVWCHTSFLWRHIMIYYDIILWFGLWSGFIDARFGRILMNYNFWKNWWFFAKLGVFVPSKHSVSGIRTWTSTIGLHVLLYQQVFLCIPIISWEDTQPRHQDLLILITTNLPEICLLMELNIQVTYPRFGFTWCCSWLSSSNQNEKWNQFHPMLCKTTEKESSPGCRPLGGK